LANEFASRMSAEPRKSVIDVKNPAIWIGDRNNAELVEGRGKAAPPPRRFREIHICRPAPAGGAGDRSIRR